MRNSWKRLVGPVSAFALVASSLLIVPVASVASVSDKISALPYTQDWSNAGLIV